LPIAEIMRLSGHSTLQAFAIYANATPETIRRGADALDTLRASVENVENVAPASELIN
jgi:hypothetical protein